MKGYETKLVAYMQGSSKRFVIPVYQRNYEWKLENCKQLYDDLVVIVRKGRKSHFFGSIVSVYDQKEEFLIIDGQQRLTTVSLLLLAMHKLLKEGNAEEIKLSNRIYEEYLIDKWQDDDTRIKLKHVKDDQKAFVKLFEDDSEHIHESSLTINYNYFYERIKKNEVSVEQLFDAITKLEIINITLSEDDNPQLIFESLNSTGVDLSEGDKIRNFILMGLPSKQQSEYYEKYWNKIEISTKNDVSSFVRDYLSLKQQSIPSQSKVYFAFKRFVDEYKVEIEDLLKDLLKYAKLYEVLLTGVTINNKLNACIYRLNRLETTVTRPFFLEVLRLQTDNKITMTEVSEIFLTTENYLFRRSICDLPTNALNKIFLSLHREIIRYDGSEDNYVAKFKYALLSKKERGRFPSDTEFTAAFSERQVYLMNSKNKIYMLERFENYGTLEDKDVYRHFDAGDYSIEHIMPQTLSPVWVKELGTDYEKIHEEWQHRIANLTLSAYNSKYSNSAFIDKVNMKNGFKESGIRLNTFIAQKVKWTLTELQERDTYLMQCALEVWAAPKTNFKPQEKQLDSYALDDDVNLNGRLIAKFSYKNIEQPVLSWIDMYERVLRILHNEDKSVLSKLAYATNENSELAVYVSTDPSKLRSALEIDDRLYVEKNTSTWLKLSVLRRLFRMYNADPTDLIFYLKEETSSETNDLSGRHELRKKYWTYALPMIKEANKENGGFNKVGPTRSHWLSGAFGIGGFSICCIAKFDSAKVGIVMSKSDKDKNKAAFDMLYTHKDEIENKLNVKLEWNRGDDIKQSNIYYTLNNVSISNEIDWQQMAKFHAEWSKKFFDVIVPYLTNN
jgi:uncharacterized protein with ParB-like and HNH nuclease domain